MMSKKPLTIHENNILSLDLLFRTDNVKQQFQTGKILLVTGLFGLIMASLLFQYSASTQLAGHHFHNHINRMITAFVAALLCSQISKDFLMRASLWMYLVSLMLLVLVEIKGTTIKGATRWLTLGPLRIEPSEFVKLTNPIFISYFLCLFSLPLKLRNFVFICAVLLLPCLLIAKQPDLGTCIIVLMIGTVQIFASGISYKMIFGTCSMLLASLPFLWNLLHSYQKNRIISLIFPGNDSLGTGYHLYQSKIAIGSGGLWGKGLAASTQVRYHFLPEFHTDFIFALISEELGLVGVGVILICLLLLVSGILILACQTECQFSSLLLVGIAFFFFVCSFVNIAMVCGLLPVVGVPLPFISYGGSNLLVCGVGLGLVWNLSRK